MAKVAGIAVSNALAVFFEVSCSTGLGFGFRRGAAQQIIVARGYIGIS